MSIQWTMIAGTMYLEIVLTILLLLPFISPSKWHSFFKSRFLNSLSSMSSIYFKIFLFFLVICFVDAIREMRKYSTDIKDHSHGSEHSTHLDVEMQQHMRLFRAQRNFYISGFSLFLCLIIQRITKLISTLAQAEAQSEAAIKQAKSASAAAEQLMKSPKEGEESSELKELKEKNRKLLAEKEAMKQQAESVGREYDRLMKEMEVLQKEKGAAGDKKDD